MGGVDQGRIFDMKNVYIAATAAFYILVLSVIVLKTAFVQGNVINIIFSASSFTIILSLVKLIVVELRRARSARQHT
jgi:hypothetical protein